MDNIEFYRLADTTQYLFSWVDRLQKISKTMTPQRLWENFFGKETLNFKSQRPFE